MKLLISISIFLTSLTWCLSGYAQADIGMSTHWYNRANYNPAFIARPEYMYIFTNARYQWTGVEGAPRVINIQASEYIHKIKSAIGVSLISDNIGATQVLNPMLTYAYRIKGDRDYSLSLGLSGGMYQRTINGSLFEADVMDDPSVQYNSEKSISPDANVGIELHSTRFIFGVSSTHLFDIGEQSSEFQNTNHRYGYVMYKNNNSDEYYYRLGLQVINRNNLTVFEGNIFVRLKHSTGLMKGPREIFDFGMSVRSSRQLSLMVGLLLRPDLRFAYAYDHSFINGYYANGTHEIMLEYRIPNKLSSTRGCGR